MKEAVGVCAIITPWNFPAAMITRKIAPALAAGCTVVIKPSDLTPFTALALGLLAERAGIPAGVVNIVTGMPEGIGGALTASPVVRKLSFTGSTRVGALLMRESAPTLKRLSLELGGMRRLSSSMTPIWTPPLRAPWPANSAMPGKPVSAPTAFWCRRAFTTVSSRVWARRWRR
jgi:hypothetical protein